MSATPKGNTMWKRRLLAVMMACALAACSGEQAPADGAAGPAATGEQAAAAAQDAAASDAVATLSVDELRAAASKAYQESRLYAPAGDNAMEYYIALRDKAPGDAGASSALIDLLPMTVIATEQARDREDFEEARRLQALIQRADGTHPAVGRLATSIDTAQAASEQRIAQQALSAEQEAERRRQLEAERARQQQEQQAQAARELAEQQEASRQAEQRAQREAAEREANERQAAERRAAEQRAAEERAAQQRAAAAAAPAFVAPSAANLRAISTPAPRYPPEALRGGQSGEVLVEFTVDADGSVSNARVVRADPPRVFDREALAAVRRWRFEPMDAPLTTRRTIAFSPGS